MNCPDCNSPRTAVVDGLRPGQAYTRTRAALSRLVIAYENSVARIRRCKDCGEEWYTIEVVINVPDAPVVVKLFCGKVACKRGAFWVPAATDCQHNDPRCHKHRCKYCVDSRTASAGPGGPGTTHLSTS